MRGAETGNPPTKRNIGLAPAAIANPQGGWWTKNGMLFLGDNGLKAPRASKPAPSGEGRCRNLPPHRRHPRRVAALAPKGMHRSRYVV